MVWWGEIWLGCLHDDKIVCGQFSYISTNISLIDEDEEERIGRWKHDWGGSVA